jgi:hypothetical protein
MAFFKELKKNVIELSKASQAASHLNYTTSWPELSFLGDF